MHILNSFYAEVSQCLFLNQMVTAFTAGMQSACREEDSLYDSAQAELQMYEKAFALPKCCTVLGG